jgi:hypothetical protein
MTFFGFLEKTLRSSAPAIISMGNLPVPCIFYRMKARNAWE